ncbi:hypothetical protein ACCO45_000647 [Purpureocillium lilacinum]|uniref:Uncharacterized protein n=1 Tax=Purpureocillium lilacinum TaxID=33203 RepID=A0ACC4E5M5_PURLI
MASSNEELPKAQRLPLAAHHVAARGAQGAVRRRGLPPQQADHAGAARAREDPPARQVTRRQRAARGRTPGTEPLVLAESGLMTEYLCEHLPEGRRLVPDKWKSGCEGKVGGETEAWMRYRYLLHYAEGSLMPTLVVALVTSQLKSPAQVPFIVRPITSIAANRILSQFVFPNALKHLRLIESYLETSGGRYLCGDALTAADILMSFPLIAAKDRWDEMGRFEGGSWAKQFPRVAAYVALLEAEEGYRKSVERIEKIDGKFTPSL